MSAIIDEHQQFSDSSGKPYANGKIYIGDDGLDPVLNPATIYSDRELTTPIANPQTLDANGRATNKVWVEGRYSMRIDDENDVQVYQELDNGFAQTTGSTRLINVQGTNTITASASPAITALVVGQSYTMEPANDNTGAVTVAIDTIPATNLYLSGSALTGAELQAGVAISFIYNSSGNFDLQTFNEVVLDEDDFASDSTTQAPSQQSSKVYHGLRRYNPGDAFVHTGTSAPAGALAVPVAATNISRTTYADLFAAIGTTWGVGDGSTTFGMPFLIEGHTFVQADSNVGTATSGAVIAHTHTTNGGVVNSGGGTLQAGASIGIGVVSAASTGGTYNEAAGNKALWCVQYQG